MLQQLCVIWHRPYNQQRTQQDTDCCVLVLASNCLCIEQVILFAPTITEGGGFEQIVGLTCDWLLLGVWSLLYHKSDSAKRKYVIWGLLGAVRPCNTPCCAA